MSVWAPGAASAGRWFAIYLLILQGAGCAGTQGGSSTAFDALGWPRDDPRVRLDTVVGPRRDTSWGNAGFFRRLVGKSAPDLYQHPFGVAWLGDGLLVSDPDGGRITRIPSTGRVVASASGLFQRPMGIAVCKAGIVVSDAATGKVALLDSKLQLVRWLAEGLARPTGVACSGDRVVVVETGEHRIDVLGPDGNRQSIGRHGAGPGEFNFPTAVAVDGDSLWVGDTLNFRVQQIDLNSGAFITAFGQVGDGAGEMPRIKGIAVDTVGHLWVSDGLLDQVALYTRSGTFLIAIGARGEEPGEFSFPTGIAVHADGRVAVADSLNRRVQVFSTVTGEPVWDSSEEQP